MSAMAELSANSQPFGDWDAEANGMDNGKENLGKDYELANFCEIPNALLSRDLSPRP